MRICGGQTTVYSQTCEQRSPKGKTTNGLYGTSGLYMKVSLFYFIKEGLIEV